MAVAPRLKIPPAVHRARQCGRIERDQLRRVPLFNALSDDAAERLCQLLDLREFKAQQRLFQAGESGDAMYLIERGRVSISVTDADGHEVTLTELRDGEFFGEMAMIDGHERSAGATVVEDSRLAVLTRADFLAFVTGDQQVMLAMLIAMAGRLRQTDNLLRHRVARNANTEDAAHTTLADRAADGIATFGGSWKFITGSVLFLGTWMIVNWYRQPGFDPYPYAFLLFILNILQAFQAPIIMMSQNRQSQKDRLRADLDYELNLKNELLLSEIRSLLHEERRRETNAQAERD
ncbi:MAG: DUF1003 domain-containing protein [Verrucomicrobiota bacterium]|nr:DUF1003 domain-containing protein [Verrucomicrobiota bacterium]